MRERVREREAEIKGGMEGRGSERDRLKERESDREIYINPLRSITR